jgi:hypothetical protein
LSILNNLEPISLSLSLASIHSTTSNGKLICAK